MLCTGFLLDVNVHAPFSTHTCLISVSRLILKASAVGSRPPWGLRPAKPTKTWMRGKMHLWINYLNQSKYSRSRQSFHSTGSRKQTRNNVFGLFGFVDSLRSTRKLINRRLKGKIEKKQNWNNLKKLLSSVSHLDCCCLERKNRSIPVRFSNYTVVSEVNHEKIISSQQRDVFPAEFRVWWEMNESD